MSKAKRNEPNQLLTLIAVAIIVLVAAGGGFLILVNLPQSLTTAPYTVVVLLVAGFVTVTLLLYLGTIILRTAGLGTRREALGMPEGSIRALIAMSLILIFAIIGVTVLYSGLGGETIESKGITTAELERLENVQVVAISVVDPAASPGAERFNVTARAELSQAGHDFGLQLLSTVSTLVVAVAGFYFGSRSVAQATKTAADAQAAAVAASAAMAGTAAAAGRAAANAPAAAAIPIDDGSLPDDDIIGAVEDADGTVEGEAEAADAAAADAAAAEADAEAADAEAAREAGIDNTVATATTTAATAAATTDDAADIPSGGADAGAGGGPPQTNP